MPDSSLHEAVKRAAASLDEFIGFAMFATIEQAAKTDPMSAHFEYVEPLRQLRAEAIGWLNSFSEVDVDDLVHMPILPTAADDVDDQLYRRPIEEITQ